MMPSDDDLRRIAVQTISENGIEITYSDGTTVCQPWSKNGPHVVDLDPNGDLMSVHTTDD